MIERDRTQGADDKQNPGLLTRFVREQCSSRDNERHSRQTADAIDTLLADHARLSADLAAAREVLGQIVVQAEDCLGVRMETIHNIATQALGQTNDK